MKTCSRCKKILAVGAKSLCRNCYYTRKTWQPKKTFICPQCRHKTKHYGKGVCKRCYLVNYHQLPARKQIHKQQEKERRKNNPERVRLLDRLRGKTIKRIKWKRAYNEKQYATNREKILEYQRNYRRADPERRDNYHRRRIAREKGLEDTLTVEQWHMILEKYHHTCAYCGKKSERLEREHKIPAIRGGGYTAKNIVPACGTCNRRKRTMTAKEFRVYLKRYPR